MLKTLKKRSLILICLLMTTLTLVGYASEASEKKAKLKKTLQAIVKETEKGLPVQMAENVIFEKIALKNHNRLVYTYTMTDISIKKEKLTSSQIEESETMVYEAVKVGLDADANTKEMIEAGVEFEYLYNDMDGKKFMNFVITKDDYK